MDTRELNIKEVFSTQTVTEVNERLAAGWILLTVPGDGHWAYVLGRIA